MARFAGLEERGGEGKLVAAPQARPGPGRTTDVPAGQWRQARHTSGFRRGACRPEDAVCVWRRSLRQRRRRVALAARAVQPRQKALEQMQLKWTEVVSASTGKTGRTILRAILAGERAPQLLATSRDKPTDRKSTRLNSSHLVISYAVFCLKKKKKIKHRAT